jgi:hypothetical protein
MQPRAYIVVSDADRYLFEQALNAHFLDGYRVKFYSVGTDLTDNGAFLFTAILEKKGAK